MARNELSEDLYTNVQNWASYPDFTDAERIALEFAEKFALDHHALDNAFFERMRGHWSDDQIVEISICVGTWLAMGRVVKVMDASVSCPLPIQINQPERPTST